MVFETLLWLLSIILVMVGMAGLLFQVIAGMPILFVGLLTAAWAEGFEHIYQGDSVDE